MDLSDVQIAEFQLLYKNHFGKDISKEQAVEKGEKLIRLVQIVYESKVARHKQQQRQLKIT
jgi:hypothetical protein